MTTDVSFRRTVDRSLVHRYAVSEVFITDLVEVDRETSLIAAQLPVSHAYFLDSAPGPARYGLTLLTECARQASTYVAHARYGVPREWKFLMASMTAEIADDDALVVGDRPGELVMTARTEGEGRGGDLRSLRAELDLALGGVPVGRITGEGRYLTPEEYEFLRAGDRTGNPPLSSRFAAVDGVPVPPALLGRADQRNVLLTDARRTPGGVTARLGVPGTHPTIFDHPLDHLPGMALVEAAAQAAGLAVLMECPDGPRAGRGGPCDAAAMSAVFTRFAELDTPVDVTAVLRPDAPPGGPRLRPAAVTLAQAGYPVAEFELTVRMPAGVPDTVGGVR